MTSEIQSLKCTRCHNSAPEIGIKITMADNIYTIIFRLRLHINLKIAKHTVTGAFKPQCEQQRKIIRSEDEDLQCEPSFKISGLVLKQANISGNGVSKIIQFHKHKTK